VISHRLHRLTPTVKPRHKSATWLHCVNKALGPKAKDLRCQGKLQKRKPNLTMITKVKCTWANTWQTPMTPKVCQDIFYVDKTLYLSTQHQLHKRSTASTVKIKDQHHQRRQSVTSTQAHRWMNAKKINKACHQQTSYNAGNLSENPANKSQSFTRRQLLTAKHRKLPYHDAPSAHRRTGT